jgi:phytoene desaturase
MHTYRDLLGDTLPGKAQARKLARKRYGPGAFMVHFGIEGSWPGIPHHMVLFGPRFRGLLADIFDHGVLPQDAMIYLHHPTVTDPSLAPPGKSAFHALVPVANLGKLTVDWEAIGPMLAQRIIDEVGRRLIPDIQDTVWKRAPNRVGGCARTDVMIAWATSIWWGRPPIQAREYLPYSPGPG